MDLLYYLWRCFIIWLHLDLEYVKKLAKWRQFGEHSRVKWISFDQPFEFVFFFPTTNLWRKIAWEEKDSDTHCSTHPIWLLHFMNLCSSFMNFFVTYFLFGCRIHTFMVYITNFCCQIYEFLWLFTRIFVVLCMNLWCYLLIFVVWFMNFCNLIYTKILAFDYEFLWIQIQSAYL